jgi:hypothetical protein
MSKTLADAILKRLQAVCRTRLLLVRALRRFDAPLVEPDGIEPTTSCLQSTRSPN